jgi:hypothetical protein
MTISSRKLRSRFCGMVLIPVVVITACDIVGLRNRPDVIQITVEGEGLDGPIPMVTAFNYIPIIAEDGQNLGATFINPDTTLINVPFEVTFDLAPTYTFALRILAPEEEEEGESLEEAPTISVRVLLDGRESFNQTRPMAPGGYIEYFFSHGS